MVLGQQLKIDSFFRVYCAEDIFFRQALHLLFSHSSATGAKRTCIASKILKQTGKQRVFILYLV